MLKKLFYLFFALFIILGIALAFNFQSDIPLEDLKKSYCNQASQFMELDGMQVHYRDEGQGTPIVLIHGTAASLHTWDDWTKDLINNNYRVIRMDIPAFGLTGPNKNNDYSIANYCQFIDQFVSKIGIDNFNLAGNSLGGQIAWNYAGNFPEKVENLILIDPAGYPTNKPLPLIFQLANIPILNGLINFITPKKLIRKNLEEVYYDDSKVGEDLVDRYHKLTLRKGNRSAFIARAQTVNPDTSPKLKEIASPTLIIWGEEDIWIDPKLATNFAADIPNAKLFLMEKVGHVPMEEVPKESLDPLLNFISKKKEFAKVPNTFKAVELKTAF